MKNIIKISTRFILLALFLVLAIQNNSLVDVKFFTFGLIQLPLFAILIVVFILGFMFGRFFGWVKNITHKSQKKSKE